MIRWSKFLRLPVLLAAAAVGGVIALVPTPVAAAASCADVEVVFARGTAEPAGPGFVGQSFVDALRRELGDRTVGLYAVNYPATHRWPTSVIGVNDAGARIKQVAAECPDTSIVLGGFSQGAAVAQMVTADAAAVPPNSFAYGTTSQLPVAAAEKVDAVALFGKPNDRFLFLIGQPNVPVGASFVAKTIDLCAANDPICSNGLDPAAHNLYPSNGMVAQAAAFAAARV
ncbi:cutinase family protein [Mycobacterium sp. pV006]|uniref:cutinase family protein n=1 Tax=Mycobacterium sp. pV006 TaxID=3238983 RepID=UPI00351B30E3